MSEPALKYENNASFEQIYTQKLLIAFKMACYCCFSFGGNLDFPEFLQKKIYNINYRSCSIEEANFIQNLNFKSTSCFTKAFVPQNYIIHWGYERNLGYQNQDNLTYTKLGWDNLTLVAGCPVTYYLRPKNVWSCRARCLIIYRHQGIGRTCWQSYKHST